MYCGDVRGSVVCTVGMYRGQWHVLWGCEGVSGMYRGDGRGAVACTVMVSSPNSPSLATPAAVGPWCSTIPEEHRPKDALRPRCGRQAVDHL